MNTTKPSYVFFVPSLEGGIGRITTLLALGMQAEGKKVEVWSASKASGYAFELQQKVKVRYIGKGSVRSSIFSLSRALKKYSPTSLISASFHANCVAIFVSIFTKTKTNFAIADHPSLDSALKEFSLIKRIMWMFLIFILYRFADKHIAVSKGVANAMSKFGRIKMSNISILPNPVITDKIFTDASVKINHPFFQNNKPVFLYVGRLSYEKDVSNLLYSFKKVQESIASHLIIIGDGPDRKDLEQIAKKINISDKISFLGHQDNPYPYFLQSDLLVLSSTREGLPTVLIEALALGLKVVSTDCPSGPSEILDNGTYGTLVKLGDSNAFAESIVSTLNSSTPKVPKSELEKYTVKSAVLNYIKTLNINSR